ncbi:MAG: betaine/proline/choline family ABC transporter ATP-binding protein [Actinomycetota bacterium]
MISFRNVQKKYGQDGVAAVRDLSLEVDEGEMVVLVGPSGCGKTTTLKMINRLIEPTSGSIIVNGTDVMEQDPVQLRRGIGYVIQNVGLLPHRTIAQNITTVPRLLEWDDRRARARALELAAMLQLSEDLLDRYPAELSGGQQQRVGVARALAVDPPVMLMDEPFGAVDPIVRGLLQDQFLEIQERLKKTIVFVTHDIDEAIKLADRIAILNIGGVLEQFAPPEEILATPANEFVKDFVGKERGLKRLSLLAISSIEVEEGPVVSSSTAASDAKQEIDRSGYDWVAVVDDGDLRGWVDTDDLVGVSTVGEATPRKFGAYVTADSSLREALDSIVTSRTNVAVVVDERERYRGILTLERISKEIIA